ncbi:MAG: ribonuclease Z [Bacteroidota bacterium]
MQFELTILGTSGALPAYGRFCSATFLRSEKTDVLIDCGEGTQLQLQKAGFGLGRCSHILISHLHGDHYFGLPGLLSSLALNGRTAPLTIVAPEALRPRISALFELDRFPMPFELKFQTFAAEEPTHLLTLGDLEIMAFPLQHRVATNGYLLREKARAGNIRKHKLEEFDIPWRAIAAIKAGGDYQLPDGKIVPHAELVSPPVPPRSFAYCSDTVYFPELADYVRGVDLLYHEATFLHELQEDAVAKGHATAREAATIAKAAGVGTLVMGHFSSRYPDTSGHEEEARAVFPNSYAAHDLWQFSVPYFGREA